MTLSSAFGNAGWRSVALMPSNREEWPEGKKLYEFDKIYDRSDIRYAGPQFGWSLIPDQFALQALQRRELARRDRMPVVAELSLSSSHAPWVPLPRMLPWNRLDDGSVYERIHRQGKSAQDVWRSPDEVKAAYSRSIAYCLNVLISYVERYGDDDLVLILSGDIGAAAAEIGGFFNEKFPQVSASLGTFFTNIGKWIMNEGVPTVARSIGYLGGKLVVLLNSAISGAFAFITGQGGGPNAGDVTSGIQDKVLTPLSAGFQDALKDSGVDPNTANSLFTNLEGMLLVAAVAWSPVKALGTTIIGKILSAVATAQAATSAVTGIFASIGSAIMKAIPAGGILDDITLRAMFAKDAIKNALSGSIGTAISTIGTIAVVGLAVAAGVAALAVIFDPSGWPPMPSAMPPVASRVSRKDFSVVHPRIRDALRAHEHVCVETTGASTEILNDLLSLAHPSHTLVVRVTAPLELCLERIGARDQTNQIPMEVESIRRLYSISVEAALQPAFTLENTALSEAEIVSKFTSALALPSSGPAPA